MGEAVLVVDMVKDFVYGKLKTDRPQMEVRGYNPFSGEELSWADAGRHDVPSP